MSAPANNICPVCPREGRKQPKPAKRLLRTSNGWMCDECIMAGRGDRLRKGGK